MNHRRIIIVTCVYKSTASYEGKAVGYKNVYFNVNHSTLVMWWITVLGMILLYEAVRYQLRLCVGGRLRVSAALLLNASIYPHYYTWWMNFNCYNDEFFDQFYHQVVILFTYYVSL